jgi:hypothetical protein
MCQYNNKHSFKTGKYTFTSYKAIPSALEKWSYIMRGVTLTLMASLEEDNLVVIHYLNRRDGLIRGK